MTAEEIKIKTKLAESRIQTIMKELRESLPIECEARLFSDRTAGGGDYIHVIVTI